MNQLDLKRIFTDHEVWLESNGQAGNQLDLQKRSFQKVKIVGNDLCKANFSSSNFEGAHFEGINFQEANFDGANFKDVIFKNVNLKEASLKKVKLENVIFEDSDLKSANLQLSNLTKVNFLNSNLEEAELMGAIFTNSNLKEANLRKVVLYRAFHREADLSKTDLRNAHLEKADLQWADFHETNLENAHLGEANLQWANLCHSILIRSDLQHANLQGASLIESNFRYANLSNANLQKADLSKADFRDAILHGADLQEVNLQGTNLNGAVLTGANLNNINIKNVNFENANLSGIKIDENNIHNLHRAILEEFGKSFFISLESDIGHLIIRSIEFPPEYHQAGISILNYFGTVLKKKYPDQKAKIKIEQDGLKVTMIVYPEEGNAEIIEKTLDEYGLLITGRMSPEEFTDDKLLIMDLKNQLLIAKTQIEMQKNLLGFQNKELKIRDMKIERFLAIMEKTLKGRTKIKIYTTSGASALSFSDSVSIADNQMIFNRNYPLITSILNELKEELPLDSVEAKTINELQESLNQSELSQSKEEVAKSSAMSKFRRFLENVEKAETNAGKVIKTTKDGIDIARQLAGHYNQIAQWCGLPQVPEPFVKK